MNKKNINNHNHLIWFEIDEANLRNNIHVLAAKTGGIKSICSVIKGNAYGHGLELMGKLLYEQGVRRFAVYHPEEALSLRSVIGLDAQIIVLGITSAECRDEMVKQKLECLVVNSADIRMMNDSLQMKESLSIHLKIDTGMNRYGIRSDKIQETIQHLNEAPGLKVKGLASHFSNAGEIDDPTFSRTQIERFMSASSELHKYIELDKVEKHMCNTAGLFNFPEAHFDFSRTGIGIMGYYPTNHLHSNAIQGSGPSLKPVLSFKTRVVSIKHMKAGEYAGYDLTYQSREDKQIAILPVGYSDGFPYGHSGCGSYVLIRGQRAQVLGRVNMNALIIDVTRVTGIQVGDEVILLGEDGNEAISVRNWIEWGSNHLYESLVGFRSSIPRLVKVKEDV